MTAESRYRWRGFAQEFGPAPEPGVQYLRAAPASPEPRTQVGRRLPLFAIDDPMEFSKEAYRRMGGAGNKAAGAFLAAVQGLQVASGLSGAPASPAGTRANPLIRVSPGRPAVARGRPTGRVLTGKVGGYPIRYPEVAKADRPAVPDTVVFDWMEASSVNSNPFFRLAPLEVVPVPVRRVAVASGGAWRQAPTYTAAPPPAAPADSPVSAADPLERVAGLASGLGLSFGESLRSAYLDVQRRFGEERSRPMDDEVALIRAALATGALDRGTATDMAWELRRKRDAALVDDLGLPRDSAYPLFRVAQEGGAVARKGAPVDANLSEEARRFVDARLEAAR